MICPRCHKTIPDDAALCCYCARVIIRKSPARAHQRGNGTGSAQKRGKTWTARITVGWKIDKDGHKVQVRTTKGGFATKNEALAYCSMLQKENASKKKKAPNLAHYWDVYSRGELEKLSKSKQVAYQIAWEKLSALMLRAVDTLSVSDLREAVSTKAATYYPARDMKVVLSHLFDLAGADGWVNSDLPDFIILPDKQEKERQPFTQDEQAALWRLYESGDRRAAIPLIMIYTGMMPGEMQNLKKSMVKLDAQQIIGVGMKTKVRKESPVYIPDVIIPVLIDEMDHSIEDSEYVWPRNEKRFYEIYYGALESAGCRKLEPYSCRHTTATCLAISENIAPQTVKKVMRWSTTRMLDRYAHPDDADVKAAVNAIGKAD